MPLIQHTVHAEEDNATLAAVVRGMYEGLSWNKARALIASGRVTINGQQHFDGAARVHAGDQIAADRSAPKAAAATLPGANLLHVDHDIVVVLKPAGVETVPFDERQKDTSSLLAMTRQTLLEEQRRKGGPVQRGLGVVQRLDKETSGVLVFPRTHQARKLLQQQFRAHTIHRRYVALVTGIPEETTIDTHLVSNRGDGKRGSWRGASKPPKEARRAITHVRVLESLDGAALVECELETGRQHQIRIHLAERGHPLVGDRVYTPRGTRGPAWAARATRTMLHAASLGFRHPADGRPVQFASPPPADFDNLLQSLREPRRI